MHFFAIEPEKKGNRKAVAARMDAIKMLYIYEQRDYPFFLLRVYSRYPYRYKTYRRTPTLLPSQPQS